MLVKVEEFIFLVDFVVLETEVVICPKNEIPVSLDRLFLATLTSLLIIRMEK